MNSKGPLILLLVFVLIISIIPLQSRWQQERENSSVDLIMDLAELEEMQTVYPDFSLRELRDAGVTGAAHPAWTLEDLIERGRAALWRTAELAATGGELQDHLAEEDIIPAAGAALVYLAPDSVDLANQEVLEAWQEIYQVEYFAYRQGLLVYFPGWQEKLLELVPGYSREKVDEIISLELTAVARLNNQPDPDLNPILLEQLADLPVTSVIFQGEEVAGFPGDYSRIAGVMQENELIYGYVEPFIADQDGSRDLAREFQEQIIRVHSIQLEEMEDYSVDRIVNRYVRAVRDRNVRYLYLRGFPPERPGEDLDQLQIQLVSGITEGLQQEGYQIGEASFILGQSTNGSINLLLPGAAVLLAGLILAGKIIPFKIYKWFYFLLALIAAVSGFILYFLVSEVFFRQLLALTAALVFPALAGCYIIDILRERSGFFSKVVLAFASSLAGGLLVAQVLALPAFYNQVEIFRGVKFVFIIPLALAALYYSKFELQSDRFQNWIAKLVQLLEQAVRIKHVLLAGLLLIIMVVYIGRTGNLPLVPVPPWEIIIRDRLEEFLTVRPRFKEFLFGHPFLFLLPLLHKYSAVFWLKAGAALLAIIGQITIVNSFSHLHTPLRITLIRTWHGFWLGLVTAGIMALIIFLLIKLYRLIFQSSGGRVS